MGGNSKQSQRTKNNARPSSSGRSAELLNNVIKTDAVFGALGTGKVMPALFPTMAPTSLDHAMTNEFTLAFKKLNKKDPITRTKALHELLELVNGSALEEVEAALPNWALVYLMLTIDNDHKVREATQACHGALVARCGRRAAPQLRRLLPAWLLAAHDDHAPARLHAANYLKIIFPDNKLTEAISFCKSEIMTLIEDNLTGNAEAILNKKTEDAEERRVQLARVLAGSLRALAGLPARLPAAWLAARLRALLARAGFWRLAAHEAPRVRAAWYDAIGSIVEHHHQWLGGQLGGRAAAALLALPERAPDVAASRWAALLLLLRVQEWHLWLKNKDLLVKRLIDILENGGWGAAALPAGLLPPLLPLLAAPAEPATPATPAETAVPATPAESATPAEPAEPAEPATPAEPAEPATPAEPAEPATPAEPAEPAAPNILTGNFYRNLFDAMFAGLALKSILNSKSERMVWITCIADCLRYLSVQKHDFVVEVVSVVHRTWLEKIFLPRDDATRLHLVSQSAGCMADVVRHWIARAAETTDDVYDKLIRNFWQNLGVTVVGQIENVSMTDDAIASLVRVHRAMFESLNLQKKTKKLLRFEDDPVIEASEPVAAENETTVDRYEHGLRELMCESCSAYLECAERTEAGAAVLGPLLGLLERGGGAGLLRAMARRRGLRSVHALAERALRGPLPREPAAARLLFLMSDHFSDDELELMYSSFEQLPEEALQRCVWLALERGRARAAGARWLRGAAVARELAAVARRGGPGGPGGPGGRLLLACLSAQHGEPAAGELAARAVLAALADALADADTLAGVGALAGADTLSGADAGEPGPRALAAAVCLALAPSPHAPLVRPLLLRLLDLQLDRRAGAEEAGAGWRELARAWRGALGAELLQRAERAVRETLLNEDEGFDVEVIEHLAAVCEPLAPDGAAPRELLELRAERAEREARCCAVRWECVRGRLAVLLLPGAEPAALQLADDDGERELAAREAAQGARALAFRAALLRAWRRRAAGDPAADDVLADVLHDAAVVDSLCDGYGFASFYGVLERCKEYLHNIIDDIIVSMSDDCKRKVSAALWARSCRVGFHWALASALFDTRAATTPRVAGAGAGAGGGPGPDALDLDQIVGCSGFFHTQEARARGDGDRLRAQYLAMVRSWYVAHGLGAPGARAGGDAAPGARAGGDLAPGARARRDQFVAKVAAGLATCSLEPVMDDYYAHCEGMFNEKEEAQESWNRAGCRGAVLRFLRAAVRARGPELDAPAWDFLNIVLCSALGSLPAAPRWDCPRMAVVSRAALRLCASVVRFVRDVPGASERRAPRAHVAALPAEWRDVFGPAAFVPLAALLARVLESAGGSDGWDARMTVCRAATLGPLAEAAALARWTLAPAAPPHARLHELALRTLAPPAPPALLLLAYSALGLIAKPLVLDDVEQLSQLGARREREGDDEEVHVCLSLSQYYAALRRQLAALDALGVLDALEALGPDDSRAEEVLLESAELRAAALGFLLTALAALRQADLARGDLVHHYINSLGESELVPGVLRAALLLLPAGVRRAVAGDPPAAALPDDTLALFTTDPPLTAQGAAGEVRALGAAACRVVFSTVRAASGAARSYWSSLSARRAAQLRRLVVLAVAQPLIDEQLRRLHDHAGDLDDAEVRVSREGVGGAGGARRGACRVECAARVEERTERLTVTLSEAHPLEPPAVASPAPAQLHWIRVYLAYQGGWAGAALGQWAGALRSRVQSGAQCYICYCRVHPASGRLPRVPCHTCGNRFHSPCLRKWFKTSKKSACPLCRTVF